MYIFIYGQNDYPGRNEVGQLQKKFFLKFVCLPCFQSGIMVPAYMLPKLTIFDHIYDQKLEFWQK